MTEGLACRAQISPRYSGAVLLASRVEPCLGKSISCAEGPSDESGNCLYIYKFKRQVVSAYSTYPREKVYSYSIPLIDGTLIP